MDTSCFLGNAPAAAGAAGLRRQRDRPGRGELVRSAAAARLQPDTEHGSGPAGQPLVTHVRLEIHPDGGMARLRLFGELTPGGRARLGLDWFDRLPGRAGRWPCWPPNAA